MHKFQKFYEFIINCSAYIVDRYSSSKNMQDCDACYHTNDKNLVDLVFYNLFYKKL